MDRELKRLQSSVNYNRGEKGEKGRKREVKFDAMFNKIIFWNVKGQNGETRKNKY